jgi:hypothetical protein
MAYRYSQQELLRKLVAAADARIAAGGDEQHEPAGLQCLAATAAVLAAVDQLQQDAGETSCKFIHKTEVNASVAAASSSL